jgi:hypothetical protein
MELRVLRFRSDEDGNVRVGVFPEREEILIGGAETRRSERFLLAGCGVSFAGDEEKPFGSGFLFKGH